MRVKAGFRDDTPRRKLTLVRQTFHRQGWIYEEKIDGYTCCLQERQAREPLSRNDVDHSKRFPDLVTAVASLPPSDAGARW